MLLTKKLSFYHINIIIYNYNNRGEETQRILTIGQTQEMALSNQSIIQEKPV
jgi:hypothetical protein